MILTGSNIAGALLQAFGSFKAAAPEVECDERTLRRWNNGEVIPHFQQIGKARRAIERRAEELRALADELRPHVS